MLSSRRTRAEEIPSDQVLEETVAKQVNSKCEEVRNEIYHELHEEASKKKKNFESEQLPYINQIKEIEKDVTPKVERAGSMINNSKNVIADFDKMKAIYALAQSDFERLHSRMNATKKDIDNLKARYKKFPAETAFSHIANEINCCEFGSEEIENLKKKHAQEMQRLAEQKIKNEGLEKARDLLKREYDAIMGQQE